MQKGKGWGMVQREGWQKPDVHIGCGSFFFSSGIDVDLVFLIVNC